MRTARGKSRTSFHDKMWLSTSKSKLGNASRLSINQCHVSNSLSDKRHVHDTNTASFYKNENSNKMDVEEGGQKEEVENR